VPRTHHFLLRVVAEIVAGKKIEVAEHGLHQATVMNTQAAKRLMRERSKTDTTLAAAKIAEVTVARKRKALIADEELMETKKDLHSQLSLEVEEKTSDMEMGSKKDKKALEGKLETAKAMLKKNSEEMNDIQHRIKTSHHELIGDKQAAKDTRNEANALSLKQIELAVDAEGKKRQLVESQYLALKAKNMKKLSDAKLNKELGQKKEKMSSINVYSQKKVVAMLSTPQAKGLAEKSLKRKQEILEKVKKEVEKAIENGIN